jgi:hypothetical protein
LRRQLLNLESDAADGPEPGPLERIYHRVVGALLCDIDGTIRVSFEFLPLPWLRTYRQAKAWLNEGKAAPDQRRSMGQEFVAYKETILAGLIVLGLVALADYYTGAAVSLMPFYIIPAAILTLIINRRWGTIAAVFSALVWALLQNVDNPLVNLKRPGVWLWDASMRFLVIEIVVLLLNRIRVEIRTKEHLSD